MCYLSPRHFVNGFITAIWDGERMTTSGIWRMNFFGRLLVVLLVIELVQQIIFSVREGATPLIRDALLLDYVQIGLLLTIPRVMTSILQPLVGVWSDTGQRRRLIFAAGGVLIGALFIIWQGSTFGWLVIGFSLLAPAASVLSGLTQSALMDSDPRHHEQNMVRWSIASSAGLVLGPALLAGALALGIDWRNVFLLLMGISLGVMLWGRWYVRDVPPLRLVAPPPAFREALRNAFTALKRREVVRWLLLVEVSDLMSEAPLAYLALYFVDVVGYSETAATFAIGVWTFTGLVGEIALLYLLRRIAGLTYLRYAVILEFAAFAAFLLIPDPTVKLLLIGLVGLFNAGWYSILKARLYAVMPGQSGTVLTLSTLTGILFSPLPLLIGVLAGVVGLATAMWCFQLTSVCLFLFLPRSAAAKNQTAP
jgi:FSR family fosmidomycin resistance protein-like MFS transporter